MQGKQKGKMAGLNSITSVTAKENGPYYPIKRQILSD